MCLGRTFPAWQADAIRSLLEIPQVDISLLIIRDAARTGAGGPIRALVRDPRHLIWNLFNKGFVQRRSTASRPTDLSKELGDTPEVRSEVIPVGKYGEKLSDEDLATIAEHDLDVILRFAFGILKGGILSSARHGVWSYHHGDEREYRGQPPGFWEIVEGKAVVGTILQRITERLDGGVVLHRGAFRAIPHSYRRTRDEVFSGSSDFASVAIRQLVAGDTDAVDANPSRTDAPVRRSPDNWTMIRFFMRQLMTFSKAQWRGLTRASKWSVGYANAPVTDVLESGLPSFEWAPEQGKSRYLADPFPDPTGRSSVVLVEDYDHETHRGVISALDMEGDRLARTVIDAGDHASYPFLIEHDGDVYCIPETYRANEVRFYRSIDFPNDWELAGTALSGLPVLDPTVFRYEDRWWLFFTLEGKYSNSKLYAYHSNELLEGWEPHLLNPIKTDITSSRPAGRPFWKDGRLYRPAQDSSLSYGGAISINRIDVLTPTQFSETVFKAIEPMATGPYRDGIHTISGDANSTVVDGRRDTFVFSSFRRELRARLRRLTRRA